MSEDFEPENVEQEQYDGDTEHGNGQIYEDDNQFNAIVINQDSNNYNKTAFSSQSTFDLSDYDPKKIFGNETYVQIIIVVIIAVSIILS